MILPNFAQTNNVAQQFPYPKVLWLVGSSLLLLEAMSREFCFIGQSLKVWCRFCLLTENRGHCQYFLCCGAVPSPDWKKKIKHFHEMFL